MNTLIRNWRKILKTLESNTDIDSSLFGFWIENSLPYSLENNILYIQVDNVLAKSRLEKEHSDKQKLGKNSVLTLLSNVIFDITGNKYTINIISESQINQQNKPVATSTAYNNDYSTVSYSDKYTFDNFVVGESNNMAHAGAFAVAGAPAFDLTKTSGYNPLFLYGDSGLGKTHLMHAIAHSISENYPKAKVLYVTSEEFTNELINSIQKNINDDFRNKYRNIDILLIDDIQFLSNKEGTQEEFFHTFNALKECSKQIIISSDRPPKDIKTLEDRLRTRFNSGLTTNISSPNIETRIAILKKKAETDGVSDIPNDVMEYIANNIQSNIRELEGALTKVIAYKKLVNSDFSMNLASLALQDLIDENSRGPLTVAMIQEIVCDHFNISVEDIISKKKPNHIAFPRQIAMYFSRQYLDIALAKIGKEFGGRDHSTVKHAVDKIEEELESNQDLQDHIQTISSIIKPNSK